MEPFKLPGDLLMGSATAALQIEGGDTNNNWYRWCEQGRIKDGTHCIKANDHWNRYDEDIAIMKAMNHDTYRMGLEWSRIEPREGEFSEEGILHYREEITALLRNNIRPLVTLHHFSHPLWFEDIGGWENGKSIEYFKRYTRFVVKNLGDLVSDWITINEPNVYLVSGYLEGAWPPGRKSLPAMFRAMKNMILAHIQAYKSIHDVRRQKEFKGDTLVGVANHIRIFDPLGGKLLNKITAVLLDYFFHRLLIEGMTCGRLLVPLGTGNYPLGRGKYYDFIGVNYYSRDIVEFKLNPGRMFSELGVREGSETNDLGWEVYPEGLYRICKEYFAKYKAPIFITENGICDQTDTKRSRYIYDHLKQVARLTNEGIPVQRYYYWTLVDNFEWLEGESARFGLVQNNYQTQERTVRSSGWFYAGICENKAVTQELLDAYLPDAVHQVST